MGECPSAVRGLIGPCGMCAQCVEAERDDLAASLDTARGERDEARDEVTALRARVEALTAERAEAVAAARRSGAEAMRAACDDACGRIAEKHRIMGTTHSGAMATWVDGIENGAKLCACFVRALPLPGDATPAGEVTP